MSDRTESKYPRIEDGDPSELAPTSRMEMSRFEADNEQFEAARRVLRDSPEQDVHEEE